MEGSRHTWENAASVYAKIEREKESAEDGLSAEGDNLSVETGSVERQAQDDIETLYSQIASGKLDAAEALLSTWLKNTELGEYLLREFENIRELLEMKREDLAAYENSDLD